MSLKNTNKLQVRHSKFSMWCILESDKAQFPYIDQFVFRDLDRGEPLRCHKHSGFEIAISVEGLYCFDLADDSFALTPGEAMITMPGQEHAATDGMLPPGKLIWLIIDPAKYTPGGTLDFGEWCSLSHDEQQEIQALFTKPHCACLGRQDQIMETLYKLRHELEHKPQLYIHEIHSLIIRILVLAARNLTSKGALSKPEVPKKVFKAIELMKQDVSHNWSTQELRSVTKLSACSLIQWFTVATGMTPRVFLIRERLKTSLSLLRDTSILITDIADQLGFSSSSHYSSYFAKTYHVQPSAYREAACNVPDVLMSEIIAVRELVSQMEEDPSKKFQEHFAYHSFDRPHEETNLIFKSLIGVDIDEYIEMKNKSATKRPKRKTTPKPRKRK